MRIMQPGDGKNRFSSGYMAAAMCSAKQGDMFAHARLHWGAMRHRWNIAETAYPGPLKIDNEGLAHLLAHADALGIDANKVIIGGVNAGGGLCAGLALLIRDRGLCSLLGQVLIYPMIDDTNIAPASDALPDTHVWSRHYNAFSNLSGRFIQ